MTALILVDLQNDFMPGGSLAVPEGDEIIPIVNQLIHLPFDLIVATKDWHPADHGSFADNHGKCIGEHIQLAGLDQILWPRHCVQGTKGSEFTSGWDITSINKTIYKGIEKNIDSYSTFFDNGHRRSTGLAPYLKEKGIKHLYIAGLATDYCVKYSVMDALQLDFTVDVIIDACRGVNLNANDSKDALETMNKAGATLISFKDLLDLNKAL
jgi:nicotinamidase/pyrazinamidase